MTQDELKLVRDVLEQMEEADIWEVGNAILAINKALANVATNDTSREYVDEMQKQRYDTTPPQRTWQGLTHEEIDYIYTGIRAVHHDVDSDVLCRAIEAKLKEKNT